MLWELSNHVRRDTFAGAAHVTPYQLQLLSTALPGHEQPPFPPSYVSEAFPAPAAAVLLRQCCGASIDTARALLPSRTPVPEVPSIPIDGL
jgi:hypothetical protein